MDNMNFSIKKSGETMKLRKRLIAIITIIAIISNYIPIINAFNNVVYGSENGSDEILLLDANEELEEKTDSNSMEKSIDSDDLTLASVIDNFERYKGILLANTRLNDENKKSFSFSNRVELNVKNHNDIDSIILNEDEFIELSNVETEPNRIDFTTLVNYNSISISEDEFKAHFENDGYILVVDKDNNEIAKIDSNIEPVDGTYRIDLKDGISNIRLKLKGFREDGTISIDFDKCIVKDIPYTSNEIENFKSLIISEKASIKKKHNIEEDTNELNDLEEVNDSEENEESLKDQILLEMEPSSNSNSTLDNTTNYFNFIETINAEKKQMNSSTEIELDSNEDDIPVEETVETANSVETEELEVENSFVLNNVETKVDVDMSSYSWSTMEDNDISFNLKLKSNDEKYDLFKNPTIDLIFPALIEDVKIDNVNVLYKNGIDIEYWRLEEQSNGEQILKIVLGGTQENYDTGLIDGTIVNFDAKIKVDSMLANQKAEIKYKYTNEFASHVLYQESGLECDSQEIDIVGTYGLLKKIEIIDSETNEILMSNFNADRDIKTIKPKENLKLKVKEKIINNFKEDIKSVVISGVHTYDKNEDGLYNESINNNSTISNIKILGEPKFHVLFSSNEIEEDEWTEDTNTLADSHNINKYKLMTDEEVMLHPGESIEYEYDVNVVGMFDYNQMLAYENNIEYVLGEEKTINTTVFGFETEKREITVDDLLSYSIVKKDESIEDNNIIVENVEEDNVEEEPIIETDTEAIKEVLKVGTQILVGDNELDGDQINERQIVKVRAIVKNISNQSVNNIKLEGKAINGNIYYLNKFTMFSDSTYEDITSGEYIEDEDESHSVEVYDIDSLAPGEEAIFEYQYITNGLEKISSEEKVSYAVVSIEANELDKFEIESKKYNVQDANLEIILSKGDYENYDNLRIEAGDDNNYYSAMVKNISSSDMNNVAVEFKLPSNLHLNPATEMYSSAAIKEIDSIDGSVVKMIIPELKSGQSEYLLLSAMVDELPLYMNKIESTVGLSATIGDENYIGNNLTREIIQTETQYEAKLESDKGAKKLANGEIINYKYTIKNVGSIEGDEFLDVDLPRGIVPTSARMIKEDGNTYDIEILQLDDLNDKYINYEYRIMPGETIVFEISAVYDMLEIDLLEKTIEVEVNSGGETSTDEINIEIDENIIDMNNNDGEIEEEEIAIDDSEINLESHESLPEGVENWKEIEETIKQDDIDVEKEIDVEEENNNDVEIVNDNSEKIYAVINTNENREIKDYTFGNITDKNLPISTDLLTDAKNGIIKGMVFNDKDGDGFWSSGEKTIESNVVRLYSIENNGIISSTLTDNRGTYTFYNVEPGKYIVLYAYDSSLYEFTKYYSELRNNFIASNVNQNKKLNDDNYAASDVFSVKEDAEIMVNFGLKELGVLDLKVDSYVSKIEIQKDGKSETYTFNKDDIRKLELDKKVIKNSEIKIDYSIEIENVGNVNGYVGQLSVSIPDGFDFDEKANPNWKIDGNKIVYDGSKIGIQSDRMDTISISFVGKANHSKSEMTMDSKINNIYSYETLVDTNEENNISEVVFMIRQNSDVMRTIVICVVMTILFVIIIIIMLKYGKKDIIKTTTIVYLLSVISVALLNVSWVLGDFDYKDLQTTRGYYDTSKQRVYFEDEVWNSMDAWTIGHTVGRNGDENGGKDYHTHLDAYMNNFYGVGTRSKLLDLNLRFAREYGDHTSNMLCLHDSTVSGSIKKSRKGWSSIAAVDFGYDDGNTDEITKMHGSYSSKIFKKVSDVGYGNTVNTGDEAQLFAYAGYFLENQTTKGYDSRDFYVRYLSFMKYVFIKNWKDARGNSYYKNFGNTIQIKIGKGNLYHEGGLSEKEKVAKRKWLIDARNEIKDFYIANANQYYGGYKNNESKNFSIKTVKLVNNGKSTVECDSKGYIGPIKIMMPKSGEGRVINNQRKLLVSTDSGSSYNRFKGKVYVKKSGKYTSKVTLSGKDADSKKDSARIGNLNNINFYLKKSDIGKDIDEDQIRIRMTNGYNYYQARMILFYALKTNYTEEEAARSELGKVAQNRAGLRGRKKRANSTITLKVGRVRPKIDVEKEVYAIQSKADYDSRGIVSTTEKTFVEQGDYVTYKITVKVSEADGSYVENMLFYDVFSSQDIIVQNGADRENDGIFFVKGMRGDNTLGRLSVSADGRSFYYDGRISPDNTYYAPNMATFFLTYKYNIENNTDSFRPIVNVATLVSFATDGSNGQNVVGNKKYYNVAASTLSDTQSVKMKMYSVYINKYIAKVTKHDGTVTYEYTYDDRDEALEKEKREVPIKVEIGDCVEYVTEISNNGEKNSNKYGNIIVDGLNSEFDNAYFTDSYEKAGINMKPESFSESPTNGERIYDNPEGNDEDDDGEEENSDEPRDESYLKDVYIKLLEKMANSNEDNTNIDIISDIGYIKTSTFEDDSFENGDIAFIDGQIYFYSYTSDGSDQSKSWWHFNKDGDEYSDTIDKLDSIPTPFTYYKNSSSIDEIYEKLQEVDEYGDEPENGETGNDNEGSYQGEYNEDEMVNEIATMFKDKGLFTSNSNLDNTVKFKKIKIKSAKDYTFGDVIAIDGVLYAYVEYPNNNSIVKEFWHIKKGNNNTYVKDYAIPFNIPDTYEIDTTVRSKEDMKNYFEESGITLTSRSDLQRQNYFPINPDIYLVRDIGFDNNGNMYVYAIYEEEKEQSITSGVLVNAINTLLSGIDSTKIEDILNEIKRLYGGTINLAKRRIAFEKSNRKYRIYVDVDETTNKIVSSIKEMKKETKREWWKIESDGITTNTTDPEIVTIYREGAPYNPTYLYRALYDTDDDDDTGTTKPTYRDERATYEADATMSNDSSVTGDFSGINREDMGIVNSNEGDYNGAHSIPDEIDERIEYDGHVDNHYSGNMNMLLSPGNNRELKYNYYIKVNDSIPEDAIPNISRIIELKQRNGIMIYRHNEKNLMDKASVFESRDWIKIKQYKMDISKHIVELRDAKGNRISIDDRLKLKDDNDYKEKKEQRVFAETGDIITYRIRIRNLGKNSDDYGALKQIIVEDTFLNTRTKSNKVRGLTDGEDILKLIDSGYKTASGISWGINGISSPWQRNGNLYIYNNGSEGLAPGKDIELYLKYEIKDMNKTNVEDENADPVVPAYIYNQAEVIQVKNYNDINILNKEKIDETNYNYINVIKNSKNALHTVDHKYVRFVSRDYFTLKIYILNVTKEIVSIDGKKYDEYIQSEAECEVGDKVVYRITVVNSGTEPYYGRISSFEINDYYNNEEMQLCSLEAENGTWEFIDEGVSDTNYQKLRIINKSGLNPTNEKCSFLLTTMVRYRSKYEHIIRNDAIIEEKSFVNNRNDVNIRKVLNGQLDDYAEMEYLTYHIDLRKYIIPDESNPKPSDKVSSISNREIINDQEDGELDIPEEHVRNELTNLGKYNNPVEYDRGDHGTYAIRIENTGETNIYGMVLKDIVDDGITFFEGVSKVERITNGSGIPLKEELSLDNDISTSIDSNGDTIIKIKNNNDANKVKIGSGDVLIVYIRFRVDKSNLYLWNLQNEVLIPSVVNKHNIELRGIDDKAEYVINVDGTNLKMHTNDILNFDVNENREYIRMKNLVVKGTVWQDYNDDGIMNEDESKMPRIEAILVDNTNHKKEMVYTGTDGRYEFYRTNGTYDNGMDSGELMVGDESRVVKATNRDSITGNYFQPGRYDEYKKTNQKSLKSEYIDYYIEFGYNGARYASTDKYAGDTNLKKESEVGMDMAYSLKEQYHTDSNAVEYQKTRDEFNRKHETINYNNAVSTAETGNSSTPLLYDKAKHVSNLVEDISSNGNPQLRMAAYSFVTDYSGEINTSGVGDNIDYLWLNRNISGRDNECYLGESDYLKEINLGLIVRNLDLKLEKDLYQVRTTINGEEIIYDYLQGNHGALNPEYMGEYATGGRESKDAFNTTNYRYKFYSSDYNYRASQYMNKEVEDFKTGTELDVELTYMITLSSDYKGAKDDKEHLYSVVNEITEFYPEEFVKYDLATNTKQEKLYTKGPDIIGDKLELKNNTYTEAFYYDDLGKKVLLSLNNESEHKITDENGQEITDNPSRANQDKSFEGYNKLYITGLDDIILDRNESKNIYIKYTLDKDEANRNNIKISNGNTVSEINSYSTYEDKAKNITLGYVDVNSNPGNVGYSVDENGNGAFRDLFAFKEYENDTYKTGIDMDLDTDIPGSTPDPDDPEEPKKPKKYKEKDSERVITGMVWDDARTDTTLSSNEESGTTQYRGDGIYDGGIKSKNADARKNSKFNKLFGLNELEEKDDALSGAKIRMVELVTINTYNPDGTLKDSKIYEESINPCIDSQLIATSDKKGMFRLQGFIPGQYVVRYDYGYDSTKKDIKANMVIFNGHDYKSTTFNKNLDDVEIVDTTNVNSKAGDNVLRALTGKNRKLNNTDEVDSTRYSDARDDAVRRLEVNGYTEYVTNKKSNVVQIAKQNNNTSKADEYKDILIENTSMYAETPTFPIRIEDDNYMGTVTEYGYIDNQKMMFSEGKRYALDNIDFGIEYRPEADVDIDEYISEIKVKTSADKTIYDLKYDLLHEGNNINHRVVGNSLNTATSKGFANSQALYKDIHKGVKGFIYLNVDADTMQGTTVEITYTINVNNISEVDRISGDLRNILYESKAKTEYINREPTGYKAGDGKNEVEVEQYRSTYTARNELNKIFNNRIDSGNNSKNKVRNNVVRTSSNYYGKFLGNTYYTGKTTGKYNSQEDSIVMMKIDGVLNYVDVDMIFDTTINNKENNNWRATTSSELYDRGFIEESIFRTEKDTSMANLLKRLIMDNKGRSYDDESDSRLALVIDDSGTSGISNTTLNKSITRFLLPERTSPGDSAAFISINTTKTISGTSDTKDMNYDNISEIVKYRIENGRVSTLATHSTKATNGELGNKVNNNGFNPKRSNSITVGNANLSKLENAIYGDDNSKTNEADTAIVETVMLAPPTGRYKMSYYLQTHQELLRIVQITILLMICVPIIMVILIKKIKNHRKLYR